MKIEYDTDIEEAINCNIRHYKKLKSTKSNKLTILIIFPAIYVAYILFTVENLQSSALRIFIGLSIYYSLMAYSFTIGNRKKIRKLLIESMDGKPYPKKIMFDITSEGIETNNGISKSLCPWASIASIEKSEKFIEIEKVGGGFIYIRCEYSPSAEELITLKKKYSG